MHGPALFFGCLGADMASFIPERMIVVAFRIGNRLAGPVA